mgnify:CR=1 FL=1
MQQAFEKNRSTQKSIFIRKHMLTVEEHYDKKVKIIEHEVDIASAYPSRLHCLTNNKLIEILGKDSKLLKMISTF